MKGFDLTKLKECPVHGLHTTATCPQCPPGVRPVVAEVIEPTIEPLQDKSKWWTGKEKELHDLFATECRRRGVSYINARTDKESTIAQGWPDFSCLFCGSDGTTRAALIEFKTATGHLSKHQDKVIAELKASGIPILVTGDFAEAVEFLKVNILL